MSRVCEQGKSTFWAGVVVSLLMLLAGAGTMRADGAAQPGAAPAAPTRDEISQLREQIQQVLSELQTLQTKIDAAQSAGSKADLQQLSQSVESERTQITGLEKRLDQLAAVAPADADPVENAKAVSGVETGRGPETTPGITSGLAPADIYNNGFFVTTQDHSFSMYVNTLFQIRYTAFKPQENVTPLGAGAESVNNFDVYLGRFAVSGSAFEPGLKYFLQFQGSTAGNSNTETLLDWFTSKTFSKYLTLQAGRFWTPYTYEYYDSPANYLFADLSTAEYAFVLPRVIGLEASGQAGRLSYAGVIGNSIPALDAPGQENFTNRVSYIGNVHYDVLAPYGYVETDPNPHGTKQPELTLWASAAYNPIAGASSFENVVPGDKTVDATSTLGFRYGFFTLQTTGYFRRNTPFNGLPPDDSWGYGEQAGYYLIPGRVELAERISGVNWGAPHFLLADFPVNTWFSGPNFPYHNITEHSVGLNFYLYGHHAKMQLSYSYLNGDTFSHSLFGANRVWVQTQFMF
ncbi:MAG: hypothetical protein ACRD1N_11505 [Terriglobia bacterium]